MSLKKWGIKRFPTIKRIHYDAYLNIKKSQQQHRRSSKVVGGVVAGEEKKIFVDIHDASRRPFEKCQATQEYLQCPLLH